jgi:hypothetical protein
MIRHLAGRDQIGRPGEVQWMRPVAPTKTCSITRSVWPRGESITSNAIRHEGHLFAAAARLRVARIL